uniref:F-box domain-containing protein n=1 Tax=Phytophthora ramorum TaxID=164328 RepID=H3GMZ3_PHYRM
MVALSLPHLPLSLLSQVLEFAVYNFSQNLGPTERSLPPTCLKNVGLVSKSWLHAVLQLMAQFKQETMEIYLKDATRAEIMAIRREILLRGRNVRDFRVKIGKPGSSFGNSDFLIPTKETELLLFNMDWNALFVHLPKLRRLDLKLVPLGSGHLPPILVAAGKFCLQMEVLVLPRKIKLEVVAKGSRIETMLKAVYSSLERWYLRGSRGGLKQLTLPTRIDVERFRSSTDFVESVSQFCPNIEYLDGMERVMHNYEDIRCEDQWMISLDTWEKFNAKCRGLREFQWAAVPFADPFFRVFGTYPKPQLRKLCLGPNLLWNWKEYFKVCGEETTEACKRCYGRRAQELDTIFKACPALTSIMINVELKGRSSVHFDIDVFGDVFWESVADNCPLLERIMIKNWADELVPDPIHTFTDASLLKMANLKYVYAVETHLAVMCTGNGIFEYLRRVLGSDTTNGDWRELTLRLGGQANGNSGLPSFYREIATLLRLLSETSEETFGAASNKQKFEVYLVNPLRSMVSRQWGATYMREQLIPLINSVRKVHPTLKATAYLNGKSGDSFKRFDRLNLIWRPDYSDSGLFVNEEEYNLFYDPSVEGREAAALSFPEPVAASTDEAPRINVFGRLTDMFDELLGPTVHNDYEESSDEDEE